VIVSGSGSSSSDSSSSSSISSLIKFTGKHDKNHVTDNETYTHAPRIVVVVVVVVVTVS
jgi:hypothetical protein